jgi:DNA polymerase III delta subunit
VNLFTRAELSEAVQRLARLDRALKTGQAEPDRLHLEAAIAAICGG